MKIIMNEAWTAAYRNAPELDWEELHWEELHGEELRWEELRWEELHGDVRASKQGESDD